uniref:Uncharacterized protein n=1 Tax=Arundo donax TaxID=35708 RepID=A0A0A8YR35_ARUDO
MQQKFLKAPQSRKVSINLGTYLAYHAGKQGKYCMLISYGVIINHIN